MFIRKRFVLTTEEISAFATVDNVLSEICGNSKCDDCILKQYCHTSFDPTETVHYIKQSIINGE